MKKKDIEYFKNVLTHQLEELEIKNTHTVLKMDDVSYGLFDIVDKANAELETKYKSRIKEREALLAGKIQDALARIEKGSFGICETCEKRIDINRLKARPVTIQCIQCKNRLEAIEKILE